MTIISLSGKKQTGKNTIAKLIATLAAGKVVELAFADALKKEIADMYRVSVSYIEEHKSNFRLILQGHGTNYRRDLYGKYYWIDKFHQALHNVHADVVVVTDCRFKNEWNYLNHLGAVMVSVSRPIVDSDMHTSETDLDSVNSWHQVILNTGTIEDLIPEVRKLLTLAKIAMKNNK